MKFEASDLDSSTGEGTLLSLMLIVGTNNYSPGLFVAGGNNCTIFTSTDGRTWPAGTQPLPGCNGGSGAVVYAVHYADGRFWAAGSLSGPSSGCGLWNSADGFSWTQKTCSAANAVIRSFTSGIFNGSRVFVAGSTTSAPANQIFMVSTDGGTTWVDKNGPAAVAADYVGSLAFYNGSFVAGVLNNGVTTRSADGGATWVAGGGTGFIVSSTTFPVVTAGGDRFLAEGIVGTLASYTTSTDLGVSWTGSISGTTATTPHRGFAYSSDLNRLVMVHDACTLRTATGYTAFDSGQTMGTGCAAIDWRTVVYDPGLKIFVAAGNTQAGTLERFAVSPSGLIDSWTITSSSTNANQINSITVRPRVGQPAF